MSGTTIWIECPVIQVRLELAPSTASSDLEILVMRAVGSGVDNAEELARYFGLPPRIMLDLVGDLWRSGLITVNFGGPTELISVTSQGLGTLEDVATGGEAETSMRSTRVEQFVLNTLTGTVVPFFNSTKSPRDRRLVVPRQQDDPVPNEVSREALADALARTVRQRGDSSDRIGDRRIVSAQLVPRVVSGQQATRYVSAEIHVATAQDSSLRIAFADVNLPIAVQRDAASRLQSLTADLPTSPFVRALKESADSQFDEPPSLTTRLGTMSRLAQALPNEPATQRQSRADQLRAQFQSVVDYLADRARHEVNAQLIHTARDHERVIRELIEATEHQLVIALPWISYDTARQYVSLLQDAVTRGVGITVLWGIARNGDDLQPRLLGLFDDLARQAAKAAKGGFVHIDRTQSSHIHSKVLLSDDRALLVTSKNYLSGSDLTEIGVVIDAQPGRAAPTLENVAKWAYHTTPNLAHANHLIRKPDAYSTPRDRAIRSTFPTPPQTSPVHLDPQTDPALLRLWVGAWQESIKELSELADVTNPVSYLVADGAHHVLLDAAFHDAERRVVVTSDKISGRVVDEDFVAQVRSCLKRGVDVTLIYGSASDERAIAMLNNVAETEHGTGRYLALHRPGNHAKVLVFDDEVVVGSYNYLSFEGVYGAGRRRERAELSVRLHDRTLTDAITRLLQTGRYRGSKTSSTVPQSLRPDANESAVAAQLAKFVLEPGGMRPEEVADLIPNLAYRERTWHHMRDVGVEPAEMARLDAALYAYGDGQLRDAALRDLLLSTWRDADFDVTAILRDQLDDPDFRPRAEFTDILSARGRGELNREDIEAFVLDEASHHENAALAVLEIIEALHVGSVQHFAANHVIGNSSVASIEPWRDKVAEYISAYGPLANVNIDRNSSTAYDVLIGRIDRLAGWNPNHNESQQTVEFLLDGPFRILRAAAVAQDAAAITEWLSGNAGDPDGGWLDAQVRLAGVRTDIKWARRRRLLRWTREIFDAARATSASPTHDHNVVSEDQYAAINAMRELARGLLPQLDSCTELEPARSQLASLIADLEPA